MFSSASSSQWRGYPDFSQSTPWMSPMLFGSYPQNIPVYPTFPSQAPRFPSLFSGQPRHAEGFRSSVPSMLPMQGSQSVTPQLNSQPSSAFAGFADSYGMPLNSSGCSSNYALPQSSSRFNGTGSAFHCAYNGNSYNSPTTQLWYCDSGATNHITNNMENLNLEHPQPTAMNEGVLVGNGNILQVTHTGNGLLPNPHSNFQLSHILHTLQITHNLISVHQFAKDNHCLLTFDSTGLVIQDKYTLQVLYKFLFSK